MKYTIERRADARTQLERMLKPGDTVHTILKHTSRSGMMRRIQAVRISNGTPHQIGGYAGVLMGEAIDGELAVKMQGCGMDMGFALVYGLSATLYPDGFECLGEKARCPSSDHSNGDRDYTAHNHRDGGYALRQQWL